MDKKERIMEDYFQGKIPTLKEAVDEIYESFEEDIYNGVMDYVKNHHLQFEISIAWDDDDEFEHEGYYDSVDDAINALMKYKEMENK